MSTSIRATFRRTALGVVAGVGALALAFGASTAAQADPYVPGSNPPAPQFRALPGVGSDTIQDWGNGIAEAITIGGVKPLGSYDATGSATIQTRPGGVSFPRPNGSGQGVAALSAAISGGANTFRGATLNYEDVQWARSSSAPGAAQSNTGALQYIAFGVDGVTYATSSNSVIPSGIAQGTAAQDAIGSATSPAPLTLRNIFRGGNTHIQGVVGSTTYRFYVGTGTPAAGFTKLNVHVPQSGSGTRSYWATTLGFSNTSLPAGVTDTYTGGSVQEHDGSSLVGDATAIVPFSIAQWIAQGNAASIGLTYGITVTDRRHSALLNNITNASGTSVAPRTGTTLNTSFPIVRPVFTVVERAAIDPSSLSYNSDLAASFVGSSALAYQGTRVTDFGFGALSTTGTSVGGVIYTRGATPASLRANPTYVP